MVSCVSDERIGCSIDTDAVRPAEDILHASRSSQLAHEKDG
jgi:hypothetical protein